MQEQNGHIVDETVIPFVMVQNFLFDEGHRIFDDPIEAYIYLYLKRRAGEKGDNAYPSIKRIAHDCICGVTTAKDRIKKLDKKGLIVRTNRLKETGGKTSNIYVIVNLATWLKKLDGRETAMGDGRETAMGDGRETAMGWSGDGHKENTFKNKPSFKNSVSKNNSSKTKTKTLNHLIADLQSKGFKPVNNPTFLSRLEAEYQDYDHDLIAHLLEIAVEKNVKSFTYLATILKSWDAAGITTLEQLNAKKAEKAKPQREMTPLEKRLAGLEGTGT